MGQMLGMYALGFAVVWLAALSGCAVAVLMRRFRRDWDGAFVRELIGGREAPDPALAPWETDLT